MFVSAFDLRMFGPLYVKTILYLENVFFSLGPVFVIC